MTETATLFVVLATAIAGIASGFVLGRWRRRRQERKARELVQIRETEQLSWRRGCGGTGDVTD